MKFANAVLNDTVGEDMLKLEKEKSADSDKASSSATGTANVSRLGSSPPTATCQSLKPISFCRAIPASLVTRIAEREDFKPIRKECTDTLATIKDLIAAAKQRVGAMRIRKAAMKDEKGKIFGYLSAPAVLHHVFAVVLFVSRLFYFMRDVSFRVWLLSSATFDAGACVVSRGCGP